MKKIAGALLVCLFVSISNAGENAAEQLVASKKKADMTYRQLMQILGGASTMIHEGIIRENKQMVKQGANIIFTHPAPKQKPWFIMEKSDQEGFKQSLIAFDKILDQHAERAVEEATKENWLEAANASHDLTSSCISCHSMWRHKVK